LHRAVGGLGQYGREVLPRYSGAGRSSAAGRQVKPRHCELAPWRLELLPPCGLCRSSGCAPGFGGRANEQISMKRKATISRISRRSAPRPSRRYAAKSGVSLARSDSLPHAIVVLGMHRSGTSALTRVISLLGADLPSNLMRPNPENEAGYWESDDLMVIHDELLASAGSYWHDWRAFNPDWYSSPAAPVFKRRILDVLRKDYASSQLFVVKDPRICRFWPVWREVLDEFGAKPAVVIAVRNPLEVMASLRRRGFIHAKSCLLWLRHVLDAEKATRGLPRAVVTYDALLADWQSVIATLGAGLGVRWPRRGAMAELEIERFLASQLRHHAVGPEQLAARGEVVDWVKDAYAALVQMSVTPEHKASMARLDRIRAEFEKASTAFGVALAEGETELAKREAENAHLRSESGALQQRVSDLAVEQQRLGADAEIATARLKEDLEGAHAMLAAERQAAAEHADRLADLEAARTMAEAGQAAAAVETSQLRTERDVLKQRVADLTDEQRRLGADAAVAAQLKEKLESVHATLSAERQRAAEQADRLADLERDRSLAEATHAVTAEEARQLRAELAVQARIAAEQSGMMGSLRLAQSAAERENAGLGCRIADLEQALAGEKEAMKAALAGEKEAMKAALFGEKEAMKAALAGIADLESEITRLGRDLSTSQSRNSDLGSLLDERSMQVTRLKSDLEAMRRTVGWRFTASIRRIVARLETPSNCRLIARSGLFDRDWYLQKYPEIHTPGFDPVLHYLQNGASEGRDPNPLFDSDWYLDQYPDVRGNPLVHYLRRGAAQGHDPDSLFDSDWYLDANPDVRAAGLNPLEHYLRQGATEGRSPSPSFDGGWYLDQYPDVRAAGVNPLAHYLHHGMAEGRHPKASLQEPTPIKI
jgi:hypothetical protein